MVEAMEVILMRTRVRDDIPALESVCRDELTAEIAKDAQQER